MKNFAVIGDPIHHSLSPIFHNAMIESLSIDAHYTRFLVSSANLGEWIQTKEAQSLAGFNVTMPLKNAIIKHLDFVSDEAQKVYAVNTVVRKNTRLYGYNTDGIGFVRSLESMDIDVKAHVALLGAGGAAIAVASALKEKKADVSIYCRKPKRYKDDTRFNYYDFDSINNTKNIDILINATPLGMYNQNQFESFNFLENLNTNALVFDLIYKPFETELLIRAKKLGFKTQNGLGMLVHQGIAALELFLDTKLEINIMEQIATSAIKKEIENEI